MKRTLAAIAAALTLCLAPAAQAQIPQHVMDQLAALPVERMPLAERVAAAEPALTAWRAAPDNAQHALNAARLAYFAEDYAAAGEAAAAAGADPEAQLITALIAFRAEPTAEPQLVTALEAAPNANALLGGRAAMALAIAAMRRDEMEDAIALWHRAEGAVANVPQTASYDTEVALIGRSAAHAYQRQLSEGQEAASEVVRRLGPSMSRLVARREITPGETLYATALAWRSFFRVDTRGRQLETAGYHRVGMAPDDSGRAMCPGAFDLDARPRFPMTAMYAGWQGVTVVRFATDETGAVTHAEAVAAVPPIRAFSHTALEFSDRWSYEADDGVDPASADCRLSGEGHLTPWVFFTRR